jgi:hypothetical protein
MGYIQAEARGQQASFPVALEDLDPADHVYRVVDAFACRLDFKALSFVLAETAKRVVLATIPVAC